STACSTDANAPPRRPRLPRSMANRRHARLNEQLKREISDVIRTGVRDPRVAPVVVTDVDTTADLMLARVWVRPMGDEAARRAAIEGLRAAAAFVRRELAQRLRVRRVPELRFELDRTLERAMRIEEILEDVRPEG